MADDFALIAQCESELLATIEKMQRAGVRYSVIYSILINLAKDLEVQGYAHDWLEKYNKR